MRQNSGENKINSGFFDEHEMKIANSTGEMFQEVEYEPF